MSTARYSVVDRIRSLVEIDEDGCWITKNRPGIYGYVRVSINGTIHSIHRAAYSAFVGPIPEGYQIDHTCHSRAAQLGTCAGGVSCRHRRCANPDHLEAVTPIVNSRRSPYAPATINAMKVRCKKGHDLTDEANVLRSTRNGGPTRDCRACRNLKWRRTQERWWAQSTPPIPGALDGAAVRRLRIAAGLQQQQLCWVVPGLKRASISRYELNYSKPEPSMVAAIARALGVDPSAITYPSEPVDRAA